MTSDLSILLLTAALVAPAGGVLALRHRWRQRGLRWREARLDAAFEDLRRQAEALDAELTRLRARIVLLPAAKPDTRSDVYDPDH